MGFAECTLDIAGRELWCGGQPVAVEPQVFDVLAHLVTHRDRVVPKTELLDEVWGDRFVSESALSSRIKSARRAVGDTGRDQRVIRTVHGRGFRFVAPVDVLDGDGRGTTVGRTLGPVTDGADLVAAVLGLLDAGAGRAIEVVGPQTANLERVVEHVYEQAIGRGHLVGRGSGAGAGLRPYGSVLDALDEIAQREPGVLDGLPAGCRAELEAVLVGREPSTRPRLTLAVRELLVAASDLRPTLLVLDELQFADPDTLTLLGVVARVARHHPLVLLAAHAPTIGLDGCDDRIQLDGERAPDDELDQPVLPPDLVEPLRLVALEGPSFDLLAVKAATASDEIADRLLDLVLGLGVVEPLPGGPAYRFTRPGLADDLVAALPPHRLNALHRTLAQGLEEAGADPARVAHHRLAGHDPVAAIPAALEASRRAAAAQRYLDVLRWTGAVLESATDADRRELLALRADALAGTGDPTAIQVYRDALALAGPGEAPGLRVGLARAAVLAGDLDLASEALAGLDPADAETNAALLVRAMLAYFQGDLDAADDLVARARDKALEPGTPSRLLDAIAIQGMIAHNRGEWFDRLRRELRTTRDSPDLAITVFDNHLCVAEYLLYGPMPYEEVITLAGELRANAERSGARRAEAFAVCVAGEARLLAGDLDGARHDLEASVALHRELGADAGTAHSLQRLAELELAEGDPASATALGREALAIARWSPMSPHLTQRIYGTLIAAAADVASAMAVVVEAESVLDDPLACEICQVMVEVPASIACAESGRLADARTHLTRAEWSVGYWEGTAWQGAVDEARAAILRAEGDEEGASALLAQAAERFAVAGQPLDAARCREAIGD